MNMTTKQRIHLFFEEPEGFWAGLVHAVIVVLILGSVGTVVVECLRPDVYAAHRSAFLTFELGILAAFTVEYLLRFFTAPAKGSFLRPLNVVDFFAIFPGYLVFLIPVFGNVTALRSLRLIWLLRSSRMLRIFKLLRYESFFRRIGRFRGTIFEAILPVIVLLTALKAVIWWFEAKGWWFGHVELGELFTIIGFALGIILSLKIASTYEKFLQIEETVVRVAASLRSLATILETAGRSEGGAACRAWADAFLSQLYAPFQAERDVLRQRGEEVYRLITTVETVPEELAVLYLEVNKDMEFCLYKGHRTTPQAYDTLLHQGTVGYLALIAVFIPGWMGLLSVFVASYMLYGMYQLTLDIDTILGGEYRLVNIRLGEIRELAGEDCRRE
jgi:hypothetical protein